MRTVNFALLIVFCVLVGCSGGGNAGNQAVTSASPLFTFVSAERTDYVESTYNRIGWQEDGPENGLIITLKWSGSGQTLTIYSSDFSLGFSEEGFPDIPRRACVGISDGRSTTGESPSWVLGGSISRQFVSTEKPYFSLLFPDVPKSVGTAQFYYANPVIEKITFPGKIPTVEK